MPSIGYSEGFELSDKDKRRKYKLPAKELTHPITDSSMYSQSYISNNSDMIQFETTVSTSVDQMAIAPGYLQKEWTENNRRYFHYKMDSPIFNF